MIPKPPADDERIAFEVVRRALGAEVHHHDTGCSGDKQVDAVFTLPEGRQGALEVTTLVADDSSMQLDGEIRRSKWNWQVEGIKLNWLVHIHGQVDLRELEEHLPRIILRCEAAGVRKPDALLNEGGPAFAWYEETPINFTGLASDKQAKVYVMANPLFGGGWLKSETLNELPAWLDAEMPSKAMSENLDKLQATGSPEQHLFLWIHQTAMPFDLWNAVALDGAVPTADWRTASELTGLWLTGGMSTPILRWGAHIGWRREDVWDRLVPR
jgi:hypothetical protein